MNDDWPDGLTGHGSQNGYRSLAFATRTFDNVTTQLHHHLPDLRGTIAAALFSNFYAIRYGMCTILSALR